MKPHNAVALWGFLLFPAIPSLLKCHAPVEGFVYHIVGHVLLRLDVQFKSVMGVRFFSCRKPALGKVYRFKKAIFPLYPQIPQSAKIPPCAAGGQQQRQKRGIGRYHPVLIQAPFQPKA